MERQTNKQNLINKKRELFKLYFKMKKIGTEGEANTSSEKMMLDVQIFSLEHLYIDQFTMVYV